VSNYNPRVTEKTYISRTEAETEAVGREIAAKLPPRATVHLIGDLGAGKTFLVRAMAAALGADPLEVSSPSFAIAHEYPLPVGAPIIHIDGYRLSEKRREWMEIGIPEMLGGDGIKFVEWPKRDFAEFEDATIEIVIDVAEDQSRVIRITTPSS
jgi:tRNA threonylcarbamoyladenosine biosynthesis protein TsaE